MVFPEEYTFDPPLHTNGRNTGHWEPWNINDMDAWEIPVASWDFGERKNEGNLADLLTQVPTCDLHVF